MVSGGNENDKLIVFSLIKMVVFNVAILAFASRILAQAPLPPEIEDPECLGINKGPAHAVLMLYANIKQAIAANRTASPFCRSLNGLWKFNWVTHPALRPVDFYKPDCDAPRWKEIPVPSN